MRLERGIIKADARGADNTFHALTDSVNRGDEMALPSLPKTPFSFKDFKAASGGTVSYTREYKSYTGAKSRCTNQKNVRRKDYVGRGIEFRFKSFRHLIETLGPQPAVGRYSLDRIDNDGHYEPGNVRWATNREQNRNKGNNRLLEYQGILLTATEWGERLGINKGTLFSRIKTGWCVSCALSLPQYGNCLHKSADVRNNKMKRLITTSDGWNRVNHARRVLQKEQLESRETEMECSCLQHYCGSMAMVTEKGVVICKGCGQPRPVITLEHLPDCRNGETK